MASGWGVKEPVDDPAFEVLDTIFCAFVRHLEGLSDATKKLRVLMRKLPRIVVEDRDEPDERREGLNVRR